MRFLEWVKWLVWDSWHGVSVSAFDERRVSQSQAPAVEIGNLRVPRWLFHLLAALLVVVLAILALRLLGVVITTTQEPAMQGGGALESVNACIVRDRSSGRTYVAVDCLVLQACTWIWFQVPAMLVAVVSFALGWICRGWVGARRQEG
jgi:hypothetical protein